MMKNFKRNFGAGGGKKEDAKSKPAAQKEQKPEEKVKTDRKNVETKKGNQKPPTQSRATTNNSATNPGNNSGLKPKKGPTAIVQFGPVIAEFLNSKVLVNKSIVVKYRQDLDKTDVDFTFCEVLPNGVSVSQPITLDLAGYMAQKNKILKKKDDAALLVDFSRTLLNRLGVDVTSMKPSVDPGSVKAFVLKHLSPIEREIVRLSADDFDVIDTTKLPELMKPTVTVVKELYGSMENRSAYLVKQINSEDPDSDIEPPNWILKGVSGMSKAVLLENLRLRKKHEFSKEQEESFLMLAKQLHIGEEGLKTEEDKEETKKPTD